MSEKAKDAGLIYKTKAAKMLGVPIPTIGRWIAGGVLSSAGHTRNKAQQLYLSEIYELLDLKERETGPRVVRHDVLILKFQMARVKRILQDILMKLEMPERHLAFTDAELCHWYDEARKIAYMPKPHIANIAFERWQQILTNINEEELLRLKVLKGDPVPYVPFLKMCGRIVSTAKYNQNKRSRSVIRSSDWINIFMLLRNQLRSRAIAMTWEDPHDFDAAKRVDMALSMGNPSEPVDLTKPETKK